MSRKKQLDWEKLLAPTRRTDLFKRRESINTGVGREEIERDYDRILVTTRSPAPDRTWLAVSAARPCRRRCRWVRSRLRSGGSIPGAPWTAGSWRFGSGRGAEAAGDLPPDLGHAGVALGAVVGGGRVGAAGEAERLVPVRGEGPVRVPGVGLGDAPAPAADALGGWGKLPFGLGGVVRQRLRAALKASSPSALASSSRTVRQASGRRPRRRLAQAWPWASSTSLRPRGRWAPQRAWPQLAQAKQPAQRSWTRTPPQRGMAPSASMAARPRRAWTHLAVRSARRA